MTFQRLRKGAKYEIWVALQASGCQVTDYVKGLEPRVRNRLFAIITKTAEEGKYEDEDIYRHLDEGIWEFKAQTARLYSFNDGRRIILTHGGRKPNKVNADRQRAIDTRKLYEQWKRTKQ